MKAIITTIPHKNQRYNTVGDFKYITSWDARIIDKALLVETSDTGNEMFDDLIAIHEIIEATLCKYRGITIEQIDEWDMNYNGPCEEPGADPNCPYFKEHVFATAVEKSMAEQLGISWDEYEKAIEALDK